MNKTAAALASIFLLGATFSSFAGAGSPLQTEAEMRGSNTLRIAPIIAMDIGVGLGASYERLLGKDKMVGIILPVSMILENRGAYSQYDKTVTKYNTYFYFTPGIKLYPSGQGHKVTYAVGPNLMISYGSGITEENVNMPPYYYPSEVKMSRLRLGVMATNYVSFQLSRTLNIGLEGGLGLRYYDRQTYSNDFLYPENVRLFNGFDITGQFSMTLGFQF